MAKKRKGEEPDFVFLDRQSIVSNLKGFPEVKEMQEKQEVGVRNYVAGLSGRPATGSGQVGARM